MISQDELTCTVTYLSLEPHDLPSLHHLCLCAITSVMGLVWKACFLKSRKWILDELFRAIYGPGPFLLGIADSGFEEHLGPDALSFEGLQWLFRQGAVISRATYLHPQFTQSLLDREEFRKPGYYAYRAWQKARADHPDWYIWPPIMHRRVMRFDF
ncbi:hypothetical protein BJ546DRAFT_53857 [Cryomyces antarcticus]